MLRIMARRMTQREVAVGSDGVLFGLTLPGGSRINNIHVAAHVMSQTMGANQQVAMFAIEGYIVPLVDPDAAPTYEVLWDTTVPKDTDVESLDLDFGTADTAPFWEPGEWDPQALFRVGLRPERIYHRKWKVGVNNAFFVFQDNQTPFLTKFLPGAMVKINIKKNFAVSQPSALMFGLAAPSFDDVSTTEPTVLTEAQIAQTKYMDHVIERGLLHQLGLVEAGAETPWEEATALIKTHVDPDIFEETTSRYGAFAWDITCEATIDHSVVGSLEKGMITSGR